MFCGERTRVRSVFDSSLNRRHNEISTSTSPQPGRFAPSARLALRDHPSITLTCQIDIKDSTRLHGGDLGRADAGRAGDGLAVLHALLLVGGDARSLGGDVRRRILLNLHHGAGIVEGLLVLAGRGVGAVLQREAVRERGGGREQEQRGGGAGSLGGEGTADGEEEQRR